MSLYARIKALIDAQWNTVVLTPKPTVYNLKLKSDTSTKYLIGVDEEFAPMPPVGLGSSPTHERRWNYRLELGCRTTDADLEKMIEETCRILDAATLTDGMYITDGVGKKTERHGVKYQDLTGYEYQLIKPGVAF